MTSITSSSATVQWMLTDPYISSRPETFTVLYGNSPGQLNFTTPEITANPTSQTYSAQLNSLQPGTEYFYIIETRNFFATRNTNIFSFTTIDTSKYNLYTSVLIKHYFGYAVSSAVTHLLVESTDDTTLVISWEPPATPNGNNLSYSVSIVNLKDGSTVRQGKSGETILTLTSLGK